MGARPARCRPHTDGPQLCAPRGLSYHSPQQSCSRTLSRTSSPFGTSPTIGRLSVPRSQSNTSGNWRTSMTRRTAWCFRNARLAAGRALPMMNVDCSWFGASSSSDRMASSTASTCSASSRPKAPRRMAFTNPPRTSTGSGFVAGTSPSIVTVVPTTDTPGIHRSKAATLIPRALSSSCSAFGRRLPRVDKLMLQEASSRRCSTTDDLARPRRSWSMSSSLASAQLTSTARFSSAMAWSKSSSRPPGAEENRLSGRRWPPMCRNVLTTSTSPTSMFKQSDRTLGVRLPGLASASEDPALVSHDSKRPSSMTFTCPSPRVIMALGITGPRRGKAMAPRV
mmetsp:Transcript_28847/g.69737  ORF Transcript_28847/g.69737 Transcript_28847/m.69737 type:complete len:338 (+) Transcript_28847:129-1142(+)